jgi:hypothetical protein
LDDPLEHDVGDFGFTGRAFVRGSSYQFGIRGHMLRDDVPGGVEQAEIESRDYEEMRRAAARYGLAAAEDLERAIGTDLPDAAARVRVIAQIELDTTTAGPGGLGPEILAFLVGDDPVGRLTDYVELALVARKVLQWLQSRTSDELRIDEGTAWLVAANRVFETTDGLDLVLVSVRKVPPLIPDYDGDYEGYLVTFRDKGRLVEVAVSLRGTVGDVALVGVDHFHDRD